MLIGRRAREGEGGGGDPLSEIGFASYTAGEGSLETKEWKEKLRTSVCATGIKIALPKTYYCKDLSPGHNHKEYTCD